MPENEKTMRQRGKKIESMTGSVKSKDHLGEQRDTNWKGRRGQTGGFLIPAKEVTKYRLGR